MSHEYAFDVKLFAVVRVKADSEELARDALENILDSCSPTQPFLDGYNSVNSSIQVTEMSLSQEEGDVPMMIEIDGVSQ